MHPLQAHILKQLTYRPAARYSELKPTGVESNVFAYHLRYLASDGYLRRDYAGYQLTAKGKRYVDKLSLHTFYPRLQPKIVTLIICRNPRGAYLLHRRQHQPFLDRHGFPYGKLHFGEKLFQAAKRELREKTGLTANLTHRGNVYLIIREKGEVVSHMLCHIFLGSRPEGKLAPDCHWRNLAQAKQSELVPGTRALQRLAQKPSGWFEEILI